MPTKLVDLFAAFPKETVNLDQDRIDRLDANIDALTDFVRDSDWDAADPHLRGTRFLGA